ncbi:ubiquitin conjugating enzyme 7 interacting protein [Nesidiocoris tenuis]|uniref:RBR-type E3 ubiquitin transferase n=1 Tax=Nesidiocoris tenuis TaxID=355587 RepID=A0ABN7BHX1_9HEMI|nr:ubiquitin conjugating enzyme 7 interacting protein [Nesidiocoris tenuis]
METIDADGKCSEKDAMIGGAGGGGDDDSGGSGRRGRGGRDGRAERPSSLVKSWYGALHEEDDDGSQKTLLPERLKWRSSLALGSSLLSRLSRSRLEMEPSGGGDQLRKVHTSPWLALTNSEPMKPINRLRTSTMCSRCSSLLSMASSSRYSISAEGQYVQVPQSQQPQSQQQHHSHSILCKLCLTTVPMADTWTLQCSCSFCAECMKAYVEFEISQGAYEISCPDAMCEAQGVVSLSEIENLVNSDLMEKHRRYRLNKEVEDNEKLIWCPSAGCETVCTLTPQSAHKVHCPSCSTDFCSLCRGPWHGGEPCPQAGPAPGIPFDSELIKCCPMCAVPIEKDEGCAQMMCKRCKHVFCWYCLASLDDDFLLRHYDKGPCKNKLGHSRASVIWHRTQVIGIFAGFGILLLVASPLLLLAAPCIVCCKCRVCTGGPRLEPDEELPDES